MGGGLARNSAGVKFGVGGRVEVESCLCLSF